MRVGLRQVDNGFHCILSPPSLHPFPFFTAGPQITVAVLHVTGVRKVRKQVLLFFGRCGGGGGGMTREFKITRGCIVCTDVDL